MPNDSDKKVILKILGATVVVFLLVYMVIKIIDDGQDERGVVEKLEAIIEDIDVNYVKHEPMPVNIIPEPIINRLPDINSSYPPQVRETTSSYIEIFSSTEKAGSGTDGWLTEVAQDFNDARKPGAAPTAG